MSFLIEDDELLKANNKVCNKVRNLMQKRFDREPMYNEEYLKTKIKSCDGKITKNFHANGVSKEGSHYTCLSVILLDSVFKYYPQVFLEEYKYVVKENKMTKFINYELEISSDDSDEENSDKEQIKTKYYNSVFEDS